VHEGQRRRRCPVVVRVRYEPSRVAGACLADAYEQVLPVGRRGIGRRAVPEGDARTLRESWKGGMGR
jgi:hypothetical protein